MPQEAPHDETVVAEEQYTEKVITLKITPRGVPRSCEMILFPEEVTVTARISVEHYAELTEDFFMAVCTYRSGKEMLPVEVSCSSPDVTSLRVSPKEVEYLIETKR